MNTIYKLTSPSGKSYVGYTTRELNSRIKEHKNYSDSAIHDAISKYGLENFDIEILYQGTQMINVKHGEKYFIKHFDTFKNGYNCTEGGDGPVKESSKRNISKSMLGNKNCVGKKNSLGHIHSAESRIKISMGNKGKKLSNYTKERLSKIKSKPFKIVSPTGVVVQGARLATFCKDNNLDRRNICSVINGKRTHHKGWTQYKGE